MQVGIDYVEGSIAHRYTTEGIVKGEIKGVLHTKITTFLNIQKMMPLVPIAQLTKGVRWTEEHLVIVQKALKEKTLNAAMKLIQTNLFEDYKVEDFPEMQRAVKRYFSKE